MSAEPKAGIQLGSKSNPLIISLTEYEGRSYVDIRKYFLKKEDGTLHPTRKGLMLGEKLLRELQDALQKNETEIANWLASGGNDTLLAAGAAMHERSKALDQEASRPRAFVVDKESATGPSFARVETRGAEDSLLFNSKHPLELRLAQTSVLHSRGQGTHRTHNNFILPR